MPTDKISATPHRFVTYTLVPLVVALAFVPAPVLLAQTKSAGSQPLSTIHVYSRETIVDVTVTDSKGNPVHGLTRDDFTVKEDGKPQPIKSFEEFGTPTTPSPALPKLPPNVYTNLQPPATGPVILLVLDGLNTAPPDATDPAEVGGSFAIQTRMKQAATKFLKNIPPGTRVAVLGLSRELKILQNVTSDPELLSASINSMDINMDGTGHTKPEWCLQQEMRNRMTLEALGQIASDASSIKGKKNLIWLSIGIPTITDPRVNAQAQCLPDYTQDLHKVYGLLAAAQVSISLVGARIFGTAIPNPTAPQLVGIQTPQFNEFTADEELYFESVAEATGGTAYYNSNDLAGLVAKAMEKGANYYTLSYVPPGGKYDYSHPTIKVEVDKPGSHLVYRQSYDAVDPATIKPAPGLTLATSLPKAALQPDQEATMRLAMGRAMPTSTDILFDVQVEPSTEPAKPSDPEVFGILDPKLKDKPLTRYGFSYAVPGQQIAFVDGPSKTRVSTLEFDLAAYDANAKLITSLSQSISLHLTVDQSAQLAHSPFRFFQQLDLPPGALFLRIGILDRTSGKIGTIEIPLTVSKPAQTK